jgi:hypothetical protein
MSSRCRRALRNRTPDECSRRSGLGHSGGDALVGRDEPLDAIVHIRGVLTVGDFLFGNCEGVYTATASLPSHVGAAVIVGRSNMACVASAGFTS